jgi:hypothetical protein
MNRNRSRIKTVKAILPKYNLQESIKGTQKITPRGKNNKQTSMKRPAQSTRFKENVRSLKVDGNEKFGGSKWRQ